MMFAGRAPTPPSGDAAANSGPSLPMASSAQTPASQAAQAPAQVAAFAAAGVDNSSPEAFIRSIAPYAERVSRGTGIPAEALIGMAANETGFGHYAEGNNLFGIKGTGPAGSFNTPTWEDYGDGRVNIMDNFRAYHSPAESFVDFAKLVTTSPRYKGAVGQTTVEGFVDQLRQGGYMTDPDYVHKISGITTRYASTIRESLHAGASPVGTVARTAAPVSRPQAGVKVPDQFSVGLAPDEAYAACGPVAAVAFAQAYGRNPTPAEALELAKKSGWTAAGGMNGIANEKRLLDKMQLPSRLETSVSWANIQVDAVRKQPVIISTPGHYFVVDGYDPSTGAYHVGQSGKVYRGGSEWMTPAQIEQAAGAPSGALFTDHPLVGARPVLPPAQAAQRPVLAADPLVLGAQPPQTAQRPVLAADPLVLAAQPPVVAPAPPAPTAPPSTVDSPPDRGPSVADLRPNVAERPDVAEPPVLVGRPVLESPPAVGATAPTGPLAPPSTFDPWPDLGPNLAAASVGTPAPIAGSAADPAVELKPVYTDPSAALAQDEPVAAPYARAATADTDLATISVPIESLTSPAPPVAQDKSAVEVPVGQAGLAVGAIAATPPNPSVAAYRQEPPPRGTRGVRRADDDEDLPLPPSSVAEDRAPRV